MNFQEHMRRIVDTVPGAIASSIMGFDGIAIDTYKVEGCALDIPTTIIEYSAAAIAARRAAELLEHPGDVTEISIAADTITLILRPISKQMFIAVVLAPGALTGKARFLMRVAAPYVAKELS